MVRETFKVRSKPQLVLYVQYIHTPYVGSDSEKQDQQKSFGHTRRKIICIYFTYLEPCSYPVGEGTKKSCLTTSTTKGRWGSLYVCVCISMDHCANWWGRPLATMVNLGARALNKQSLPFESVLHLFLVDSLCLWTDLKKRSSTSLSVCV